MCDSIEILNDFPNLQNNQFRITSPCDKAYNCIAWALKQNDLWWEPDKFNHFYWPSDAFRAYTLNAFICVFQSFGYVFCTTEEHEPGFEKLAIYIKRSEFSHVARQIDQNLWASKLGKGEDIEHTLEGLKGEKYGNDVIIMKRPLK